MNTYVDDSTVACTGPFMPTQSIPPRNTGPTWLTGQQVTNDHQSSFHQTDSALLTTNTTTGIGHASHRLSPHLSRSHGNQLDLLGPSVSMSVLGQGASSGCGLSDEDSAMMPLFLDPDPHGDNAADLLSQAVMDSNTSLSQYLGGIFSGSYMA